MSIRRRILYFLLFSLPLAVLGKGHAPYCVFFYDGSPKPGDILVNEVRPTITTTDTYFNALGWSEGYTGMQENENGHRCFIFSLWDSPDTQHRPITAVYAAPGAKVEPFDGEGTGLHYLNNTQPWELNQWVRFVVRRWDRAPNTYLGLWTQAENTGKWTHHVTMLYPAPQHMFTSFSYSFLEDWTATDLKRAVQYRHPAERLADGTWFALSHASFKVDEGYTGEGPFANAYDAGVEGDAFFAQSGGDTKPTVGKSAKLALPDYTPMPDLPDIGVTSAHASSDSHGRITVSWQIADHATPQFSYVIETFDNSNDAGTALSKKEEFDSEARQTTIDSPRKTILYGRLTVTDILGGASVTNLGQINL
jgi:hypothetical protein